MTGTVELVELDEALLLALEEGSGTLEVADGFPREEDAQAIDAVGRGALSFVILRDGVVVGTCGTHGPPARDRAVELGWGLVEGARSQGIGSAAIALLLKEMAARYPGAPLTAHTLWEVVDGTALPESPASEAILVANRFRSDHTPSGPGRRAWRREG